jgi:hypothetical protein
VEARQPEIDRLQASLESKRAHHEPNNGVPDRELALSAVKAIHGRRAEVYGDWLAVGMALHSVGSDDEMLAAWKAFSALCPEKFSEQVCDQKWRSFNGTGVTIATLLKWASEDGWQRPGRNGRPFAESAQTCGLTGYDVILAFFRKEYEPTFRRETHIYSRSFGREVSKSEALAGAPKELIDLLAQAVDAPRWQQGGPVKHPALPSFFKTWAPSAWMDLIRGLPAEQSGEEISETAGDQFRTKVSAAMLSLVTLAVRKGDESGHRSEPERRTLVDWCQMFAKPKVWAGIRGYQIWCRRDQGQRLRIALRFGLFNQAGVAGGDLGRLGQKQFNELAKRYDVGTDCKVSGGGERAVELLAEFLDDILAAPAVETDEGHSPPSGSSAPFDEKHWGNEANGQTDDPSMRAPTASVRPSVCPSDENGDIGTMKDTI